MANKQKAKIAAKQRAAEYEAKAQKWQERHQIAEGEQAKLFEKFKDWFNILYAVKSSKNIAPWRSKIYIPILAGKAWDFISRLADVEPRFIAGIQDEWQVGEDGKPFFPEEVLQRAEKISQKMGHDWKNPFQHDSPRDRVFSTLVDTVVTGTGVAKVGRVVKETKYKAHEAKVNGKGETDGNVNLAEEIIKTVTEGANTYEPVNIFNVKFAPGSYDGLQKAPWIIIDSFQTYDELEQAGIYTLEGVDKEFRADSDPNAQYNHARNELLQSEDGLQRDSTVKKLAVHECYSRNAEGQVVIETYVEGGEENWTCIRELVDPYWHNRYPLQSFHIRRKPYSVWGESLFENNETLQYASNDVFNHYMDNLNLSLDGMIMMEENAFVEDFVVAPGELLMYKNEMPKQFKFNEPNPQQLTQVLNEMQKAVEAATVSQYATGTPDSANDSTEGTATGITKIMEAAEDKMGFMRSNFKSSMEGIGQMFLINDQQFMDRPATIPVEGPEGTEPIVITPLDIQGIVTITIDDDSLNPVSKSAKREMKSEYLDRMEKLAANSRDQAELLGKPEDALRLNYQNVAKELSFAFGENNFSQLLIPGPTEEELAAQAEAAAAPEPEPEPSKSMSIAIAYKDVASPEAKAALLMEALVNYEGDPLALIEAERRMQTEKMAHEQTIDIAKAMPEPEHPKSLEEAQPNVKPATK